MALCWRVGVVHARRGQLKETVGRIARREGMEYGMEWNGMECRGMLKLSLRGRVVSWIGLGVFDGRGGRRGTYMG